MSVPVAAGDVDEDDAPLTTVFPLVLRVTVYATQFLDTSGLTMFLPLIPYYFITLQGYTQELDGLLFGLISCSYSFGQLIGNLLFGSFSDRFGRRKLLLVSTLSQVGFGVWTAFVPSVWQLAVARFGAGLMGGTAPTLQSYVADITSRNDRAKEMGRLGAFNGFGLLGGPVVGIVFGFTLKPIELAWFVSG
jgi:DHA1 family tetracycline resistance protein-like MFS transporter